MKKILILICIIFSINSFGQIDTVYVRNLQLKGEEWWWCIRGLDLNNMDSLHSKYYNRLVSNIKAANLSSATLFTFDSLPGSFSMTFFDDYWSRPEARDNMGQGIDTKLRAYPPLAPYIANSDAQRLAKFNARKKGGKNRTN